MYKLVLAMSVIAVSIGEVPLALATQIDTSSTKYISSCKSQLSQKKQLIASDAKAQQEAVITEQAELKAQETVARLKADRLSSTEAKDIAKIEESIPSGDLVASTTSSLTSNVVIVGSHPGKSVSGVAQHVVTSPVVPEPAMFQLKAGRLRPQIKKLVLEHFENINSFVWSVDTNLQWFNNFDVKGETYNHILSSVLRRYGVKAVFWGNNVVEIVPIGERV